MLNTIKLIPISESEENGPIKAGQNGYFDIEINADGTEVSLEYSIKLDLTKMPEEIHMTSYSIIQNNIETNKGSLPANNEFSGEMLLSNGKISQADSIKYRIYWQWNGEDYDISHSSYEVDANIEIEQKIA